MCHVVLVVEDSLAVRTWVQRVLEIAGHEVVVAGTIEDGKRELREGLSPDVLVCDLGLPDSDTGETLRWLYSIAVPTVVMTGTRPTSIVMTAIRAANCVHRYWDKVDTQKVLKYVSEAGTCPTPLSQPSSVRSGSGGSG